MGGGGMRQVYRFDNDGIYIEPVLLKNNDIMPDDCTEIHPPDGLYRAKFTGTEWVEDMSKEEIDALQDTTKLITTEERVEAIEKALLDIILGGGTND